MEDELDYPEDDMDLMIDEELQIMRELEAERENKENHPTSSLRPCDTNVGIGSGKRLRSSGDDEESEDHLAGIWDEHKSPSKVLTGAKRFRGQSEDVLMEQASNTPHASPARIRIPRMGERKIYRRIPEGSDFQAITATSGDRYYIRMLKESPSLARPARDGMQPVGLCGVPFRVLQQQADQVLAAQAAAAAVASAGGQEEREEDQYHKQTQLWVEKYKPRSYMDLLSEEGTNRTLLLWLKLWDKLVFNKEKKQKHPVRPSAAPIEAAAAAAAGTTGQKFGQKWRPGGHLPEVVDKLDETGRPQQRVALLHGPPGLGKTTLAHIVARHAGYKVVEMNASDDRSVEAFKKQVESATQMRSVVAGDQRPNCLVIDEIDGAPAPTIAYLISLLTDKAAAAAGKKKGKKGMQVLRPIICICNDLYTPALRPLRQLALVIPFPPTSSSKLAARLKEVAAAEDMRADLTALLTLCKKTDNDIRSCLASLQFFRKRGRVLHASDVADTAVGTKDSQKSLFSVWDEVFTVPRAEGTQQAAGGDTGACRVSPPSGQALRFKHVLESVSSCGEYDRVITGVFENYLTAKFRDTGLQNVVKGCEWFVHFDLVQEEVLHSQIYTLTSHMPFPLVAAHFLFASMVKCKVSFPTQMTDCRNRLNQTNNVLASILSEMSPSVRSHCSRSALIQDLLPALLSVIQPVLRPVNTMLYSAKEKADLANLVKIHINYNITYTQERNAEGQYEYKMDPDVESVVMFSGISRTVQLSYGAKQLVAHEIELEKMRRLDAEKAQSAASNKCSDKNKTNSPASTPGKEATTPGSKTTTSHLAKLTPKQGVIFKEKQATDFFGRVIKASEQKKGEANKAANDIVKTDIWFKFKEGYSNAVRRTIKMKDLL